VRTTRKTRIAAAAGATAVLTGLVTTSTALPVSAGSGCTPTWTTLPAPDSASRVSDVEVLAANDVRFTDNIDYGGTQMLRWDGNAMTAGGPQLPVPPRADSGFQVVQSSFDSATSGWAIVDFASHVIGTSADVLGRWNNNRWTLTPAPVPPNPESGGVDLYDLASVSPTAAWAVGGSSSGALIARWDGAEWQYVGHPADDLPGANLSSIAAVSASDIWAAGFSNADGHTLPLVLHYDGATWTKMELPATSGPDAQLNTVTATGPNDVWIGGWTSKGDEGYSPLLMRWDGNQWSSEPAPPKSPIAVDSGLDRLYVAGPGDLWATVSHRSWNLDNQPPTLFHGDGTTWQVVRPQGSVPKQYHVHYVGVGGSGPDDVWAVGTSTYAVPSELPGFQNVISRRLISHLSCGGK
jgi:hypothetical protein